MKQSNRAIIRSNIIELVETFPVLKKNRNNLCAFYWLYYDGATSLEDIKDCTPAETITREFRTAVTMGKLVLDVDIKKALKQKEYEYEEEALSV